MTGVCGLHPTLARTAGACVAVSVVKPKGQRLSRSVLADVARARVVASREGEMDVMTVEVESEAADAAPFEASVAEIMKLKGRVRVVPLGSLPNDGKVIEDLREYD